MAAIIRTGRLLQWAIVSMLVEAPGQTQEDAKLPAPEPSVCLMAVVPPNAGEKSLANPAGGNLIKQYAVQIDNFPQVLGLPDKGVAFPRLSLGETHLVRVFGDGKQVASFRFQFEDFSTNDLCLAFEPFYVTWRLRNCEDAGSWGACHQPRRLLWVEVKSCEVIGKRIVPVRRDPQISGVEYYTDYQIRYFAEGREVVKYISSGLPPDTQRPSSESLKVLPSDCRYTIRYHPGMPEKGEVIPRRN